MGELLNLDQVLRLKRPKNTAPSTVVSLQGGPWRQLETLLGSSLERTLVRMESFFKQLPGQVPEEAIAQWRGIMCGEDLTHLAAIAMRSHQLTWTNYPAFHLALIKEIRSRT